MSLTAMLLALGMVRLDQSVSNENLSGFWWIYAGGAEGARAVLSTVASSMITVAGTTFSITVAVLALASSQFGPRLLGNFMRDRTNQAVLGAFVASFIYCLLVLRTVRGTEDDALVPHLAVTAGVLLAVIDLAALIYFIHHVSDSIQAPQVVAKAGRELDATVDRLFPERVGQEFDPPQAREWPAGLSHPLVSSRSGYLQALDTEQLVRLARENDLRLRLLYRPGQWIVRGDPLILVSPHPSSALGDRLRATFALGDRRTHFQDVEFGVNQLVEIALRALSPSLNDPFTAFNVIDQLAASLAELTKRELPSQYRADETGKLRVIAPAVGFEELLETAFKPIVESAGNNVRVLLRLYDALEVIAARSTAPERRAVLLQLGRQLEQIGRAALTRAPDQKACAERRVMFERRLEADLPAHPS
jgi:uncharacterized membrane protein